jgi:hypothetical protein
MAQPAPVLNPEQEEHFKRLVEARRRYRICLDGSEMGRGKTKCAVYMAYRFRVVRVIVICPANLRAMWIDNIEKHRWDTLAEFQVLSFDQARGTTFPVSDAEIAAAEAAEDAPFQDDDDEPPSATTTGGGGRQQQQLRERMALLHKQRLSQHGAVEYKSNPFLMAEFGDPKEGERRIKGYRVTPLYKAWVAESIALIVDEGHMAKNRNTSNSMVARAMLGYIARAEAIPKRTFALVLSGTLFSNNGHLMSILQMIGAGGSGAGGGSPSFAMAGRRVRRPAPPPPADAAAASQAVVVHDVPSSGDDEGAGAAGGGEGAANDEAGRSRLEPKWFTGGTAFQKLAQFIHCNVNGMAGSTVEETPDFGQHVRYATEGQVTRAAIRLFAVALFPMIGSLIRGPRQEIVCPGGSPYGTFSKSSLEETVSGTAGVLASIRRRRAAAVDDDDDGVFGTAPAAAGGSGGAAAAGAAAAAAPRPPRPPQIREAFALPAGIAVPPRARIARQDLIELRRLMDSPLEGPVQKINAANLFASVPSTGAHSYLYGVAMLRGIMKEQRLSIVDRSVRGAEEIGDDAGPGGGSGGRGGSQKKLNVMSEEARAKMTRALVAIEIAKVDLFVRLAMDALKRDPRAKVVIAVSYTQTLIEVVLRLSAAFEGDIGIINGDIVGSERIAVRERFQEPSSRLRVIVGQTQSISLGIDLDDQGILPEYMQQKPLSVTQRARRLIPRPRYAFVSPSYFTTDMQQFVRRFFRATTRENTASQVRFVYGWLDMNVMRFVADMAAARAAGAGAGSGGSGGAAGGAGAAAGPASPPRSSAAAAVVVGRKRERGGGSGSGPPRTRRRRHASAAAGDSDSEARDSSDADDEGSDDGDGSDDEDGSDDDGADHQKVVVAQAEQLASASTRRETLVAPATEFAVLEKAQVSSAEIFSAIHSSANVFSSDYMEVADTTASHAEAAAPAAPGEAQAPQPFTLPDRLAALEREFAAYTTARVHRLQGQKRKTKYSAFVRALAKALLSPGRRSAAGGGGAGGAAGSAGATKAQK